MWSKAWLQLEKTLTKTRRESILFSLVISGGCLATPLASSNLFILEALNALTFQRACDAIERSSGNSMILIWPSKAKRILISSCIYIVGLNNFPEYWQPWLTNENKNYRYSICSNHHLTTHSGDQRCSFPRWCEWWPAPMDHHLNFIHYSQSVDRRYMERTISRLFEEYRFMGKGCLLPTSKLTAGQNGDFERIICRPWGRLWESGTDFLFPMRVPAGTD